MRHLGLTQWLGILLACGSVMLIGYEIADRADPAGMQLSANFLLRWPFAVGVVGLVASGLLVQFTWRTKHG